MSKKFMQLRDHPLMMSGRDVHWPPQWGRINGSRYHEGGILRGEIGTLVEVIPAKIAPFTRCHLLIDFEKVSYLGTLFFDDESSCRRVCEFLEQHIGKSIQAIGSLEFQ